MFRQRTCNWIFFVKMKHYLLAKLGSCFFSQDIILKYYTNISNSLRLNKIKSMSTRNILHLQNREKWMAYKLIFPLLLLHFLRRWFSLNCLNFYKRRLYVMSYFYFSINNFSNRSMLLLDVYLAKLQDVQYMCQFTQNFMYLGHLKISCCLRFSENNLRMFVYVYSII